MDRKRKKVVICTGAVSLAVLSAVSVQSIGQKAVPEQPTTPPAYHLTYEDRTPQEHNGSANILTQNSTQMETPITPPTEIDFKPPIPNDSTEILPPTEPPRDKPSLDVATAPSPNPQTSLEPKMGDSRFVDGQKQVYVLGFGWIEDNNTPNEGAHLEDMYENGNKIGEMGSGGTIVDGDTQGADPGDINKMVGTMDGGEVGRSCGDINKIVEQMD